MSIDKAWYSIELPKDEADILKEYFRKACVYFEPSEAGHLVHFECLMTKEECTFTNDYLRKNIKQGDCNNDVIQSTTRTT